MYLLKFLFNFLMIAKIVINQHRSHKEDIDRELQTEEEKGNIDILKTYYSRFPPSPKLFSSTEGSPVNIRAY